MKTIKSFCFLLLIITGYESIAQDQKAKAISIVQNFEPGKTYKYEVIRGKIDSRQPGSEDLKTSTDVELSVVPTKEGLKSGSWKYGVTRVVGIDPILLDEQTKKIMNLNNGVEIRFHIDKNGVLQEITNFEECKAYIENSFKTIYETRKDGNPEAYKKTLDVLKATYETPEMLIGTYCPEFSLIFSTFGDRVHPDSVYLVETELPNPFGGNSFPAETTTKVDTIVNTIATISIETNIPPKELKRVLKETMNNLAKISGKSQEITDKDIPAFNIYTITTLDYDFKNSVLKKVYGQKFIDTDGTYQNQTLKVILKN